MGCPYSKSKPIKKQQPSTLVHPIITGSLPPPTIVKLKGADELPSPKILKNGGPQKNEKQFQTDPEAPKSTIEAFTMFIESQKQTNCFILEQLVIIKEQNELILKNHGKPDA